MDMTNCAEQPHDLFAQILALGHKWIVRIPPQYQDDFKAELVNDVYLRWPEFDPDKGQMSTWVTWRVMAVFKKYCHGLKKFYGQHRLTGLTATQDRRGGDSDGEDTIYRLAPGAYEEDDEDDPRIVTDRCLERLHAEVPLTDAEMRALELRIGKFKFREIGESLGLSRTAARKVYISAMKKVEYARVVHEERNAPSDYVDRVLRAYVRQQKPFPATRFTVSVPKFAPGEELHGSLGVRKAVEMAKGSSAVRGSCTVNIPIREDKADNAEAIWYKYGSIIRGCSGLKIEANKKPRVFGSLSAERPGADVVWGVMLASLASDSGRIRSGVRLRRTLDDFSIMETNLRRQGVVYGPAMEAAVQEWRGCIRARNS